MVKWYKAKPKKVRAIEYTGETDNLNECVAFVHNMDDDDHFQNDFSDAEVYEDDDGDLVIIDIEDKYVAQPGDILVKGDDGISIMQKDEFHSITGREVQEISLN